MKYKRYSRYRDSEIFIHSFISPNPFQIFPKIRSQTSQPKFLSLTKIYSTAIVQKKNFWNSQLLSCVENVATETLLLGIPYGAASSSEQYTLKIVVSWKPNWIHWRAWNNRVIKKGARTISLYRAWVSSIKVLGRFYRRILGRDPSIQLFDYFSSPSLAAA